VWRRGEGGSGDIMGAREEIGGEVGVSKKKIIREWGIS